MKTIGWLSCDAEEHSNQIDGFMFLSLICYWAHCCEHAGIAQQHYFRSCLDNSKLDFESRQGFALPFGLN